MARTTPPDIIDISDSDDEPIILITGSKHIPASAPGSETLVIDSTDTDDSQEFQRFLGRISITKTESQVPTEPKAGPSKSTSPIRDTRTLPASKAKALATLSSGDEESDPRTLLARAPSPPKVCLAIMIQAIGRFNYSL